MLYNVEQNAVHQDKDCFTCQYFDKQKKKCCGLNKACFEYDPKSKIIIDGVTHLPLKKVK